MKNIGIFTPIVVSVDELTNLGLSQGGLQIGVSTLRFGEHPDEAYLELTTDLTNGCFDEDEFRELEEQLGFPPASYISVDLNYGNRAFERAMSLAQMIQDKWKGALDLSGAGQTFPLAE